MVFCAIISFLVGVVTGAFAMYWAIRWALEDEEDYCEAGREELGR